MHAAFNQTIDLNKLGLVIVQLVLISVFIHHFNVEAAFNLPLLFPLLVTAFLIRLIIPLGYRQWYFILVTVTALVLVLSWVQTGVLITLTLCMIVVCNLPIALIWRQTILFGLVIWLAFIRVNSDTQWLASSTLTILASMFMFRMLLFLYELKHQKHAVPLKTQVSYFLMPPNVIFPLFPVVDYKLFQRNYLAAVDFKRVQRGVNLIAKGVLFLFLYRVIYSFLLPARADVDTPQDLMAYISFSYLLTIRLAGIFHFSIGVLHLFGYQLPDVFRNHFFASSFGDLWRRLNIYWKDFIIKLVFNPLYFKLRGIGSNKAIFLATLITFAATMLLHQYQTFWLSGVFSVEIKDVVFWGAFGCVVAFESLRRSNHHSRPFVASITLVGKTLLTFSLVSLIWSIWVSADIQSWLGLMAIIAQLSLASWIKWGVIVLVMTVAAGCLHYWCQQSSALKPPKHIDLVPAVLLAVLIATFNQKTLNLYWDQRLAGNDIHRIFHFVLSREDSQNKIAGYYDNILASGELMSPLMNDDVTRSKMFQKQLFTDGILFESNDAFKRKFKPSTETVLQSIEVSVNRWGMYDKDYKRTPQEKTFRIAFLGGSIEMGWALAREDTMEILIEERLNNTSGLGGSTFERFEILNFSVPSRNLLNHHYALREQVLSFKPNMVVLFDHDEADWVNIVSSLQNHDYSREFDGVVTEIYQSIAAMKEKQLGKLLNDIEPFRKPLLNELYRDIFAWSTSNDALPVIVAMPELIVGQHEVLYGHSKIAEEIGYEHIDLTSIIDGNQIEVSSMDTGGHPTAAANKKIANQLFTEIEKLINKQSDSQVQKEQ